MKMTKKLIFAAVAVAVIAGFASCQKEIGGIDWKGGVVGSGDGTTTFKVNQENDSETNTVRGFKQVGLLNRAQGTCVVTQHKQSNATCDGMVGFATYFVENKATSTYNFLVVGVRNNKGITETYASYFCNISEDDLDEYNFGASYEGTDGKLHDRTKDKFDATSTEPYEVVIEKFPMKLNHSYNDKGDLIVGIKFEQVTNGDINITWYRDLKTNTQAATTSGGTVLDSSVAEASKTGRTATSEKGKICAYANIQPLATLDAQWDFYDISWKKVGAYADEDDYFIEVGDIIFE